MKTLKIILATVVGAALINSCSTPNAGSKSNAFGYSNTTGRTQVQNVQPKATYPQNNYVTANQPDNRNVDQTNSIPDNNQTNGDSYTDDYQSGTPNTVINNYYGYSSPSYSYINDRYYGPYDPSFNISIGFGNYYYRPYYYDNWYWSSYYWPRHNIIFFPSYYPDPYWDNYYYTGLWHGCRDPYYYSYYHHNHYYDYHYYDRSHESYRPESYRNFGSGRNSSTRNVANTTTPGYGTSNSRRNSGTGSGIISTPNNGSNGRVNANGTAVNNGNSNSRRANGEGAVGLNSNPGRGVESHGTSTGPTGPTNNNVNKDNSRKAAQVGNMQPVNTVNERTNNRNSSFSDPNVKVDGKRINETNNETGNAKNNRAGQIIENHRKTESQREIRREDSRRVESPRSESQREVRREESRRVESPRSEPQREVRREEPRRVESPRSEPARSEPSRSEPSRSGSSESNRRR